MINRKMHAWKPIETAPKDGSDFIGRWLPNNVVDGYSWKRRITWYINGQWMTSKGWWKPQQWREK